MLPFTAVLIVTLALVSSGMAKTTDKSIPKGIAKKCEELGYCFLNPCNNSGNCIELEKGFECQCPPHFAGPTCDSVVMEVAVDERVDMWDHTGLLEWNWVKERSRRLVVDGYLAFFARVDDGQSTRGISIRVNGVFLSGEDVRCKGITIGINTLLTSVDADWKDPDFEFDEDWTNLAVSGNNPGNLVFPDGEGGDIAPPDANVLWYESSYSRRIICRINLDELSMLM